MTEEKRPRGRPKGSSRYSETDERLMQKVVNEMALNKLLTKTAAIRRVIGGNDQACIHRLQAKLKGTVTERVQEKRERIARIQHEQELGETLTALDTAVPQFFEGVSQFVRTHKWEIKKFLFLMERPIRDKDRLYQQLGITPQGLEEFAKHLVAFRMVMTEFSTTEGMTHLADLFQRLEGMPQMIAASAALASGSEDGVPPDERKGA